MTPALWDGMKENFSRRFHRGWARAALAGGRGFAVVGVGGDGGGDDGADGAVFGLADDDSG